MNTHRLTHTIAVALALTAIAAPTATAQEHFGNPDTKDYAEGRFPSDSPEVVIVKVPGPKAAPASGIDWADAGIGAGTILGLSLLGAGGGLVLVRRRQAAGLRLG